MVGDNEKQLPALAWQQAFAATGAARCGFTGGPTKDTTS
jgi:hypothetical protein